MTQTMLTVKIVDKNGEVVWGKEALCTQMACTYLAGVEMEPGDKIVFENQREADAAFWEGY